MGPVFFAAYLVVLVAALRRGDWPARWLVWMSAPIIVLVCVQALLSRAYANWAAPAYVAGIVLTAPWLLARAPRIWRAGTRRSAMSPARSWTPAGACARRCPCWAKAR